MLKYDINWLIFRCGTGLIQDIFNKAFFLQFDPTSCVHPSALPVSLNKDLMVIYSTKLVWKTSQVLLKSNLC